MNENSGNDEGRDLEERIARHMEEFGHPAFGDNTMPKSLMFKSLMSYHPEVDLGALRIVREVGLTHVLLVGLLTQLQQAIIQDRPELAARSTYPMFRRGEE